MCDSEFWIFFCGSIIGYFLYTPADRIAGWVVDKIRAYLNRRQQNEEDE